ncbi:MAG: hypothetical protein M3N54_02590 [Acidobacteriota bacterium]|nr:hypothetical protein [Acidobacteriota bacterium]
MIPARNSESGFALLFVYAMAAAVAIMLYMQLPRVAFEAQREKEQLLIDRGQQYSRAVQLYVRKFQRFPQNFEALENTQNLRFLRKQYVDPMTGKNEWRIIHVGPGGTFLDSQVYGNQQKKDAGAPQSFITELQQVGGGGAPATGQEGVNLATRRRPSDQPGAPGDLSQPGTPGSTPGNALPNPGAGTSTPINGPVMVLPDGRIVPATSTGIPAPPPQPVPGQPGLPVQQGQNGLPAGFQSTPNQGNAPPTSAANMINQILTTPRPQPGQPAQGQQATGDFGSPAQPGTGTSAGQTLGGQIIGGGMAGVASKYEQEGIKIYNDRTAYNQWEFVYDMTKDPTRTGGQGGGRGGAAPTPGTVPVSTGVGK